MEIQVEMEKKMHETTTTKNYAIFLGHATVY